MCIFLYHSFYEHVTPDDDVEDNECLEEEKLEDLDHEVNVTRKGRKLSYQWRDVDGMFWEKDKKRKTSVDNDPDRIVEAYYTGVRCRFSAALDRLERYGFIKISSNGTKIERLVFAWAP